MKKFIQDVKETAWIRRAGVALLVAVLLELFVFNLRGWQSLAYQEKDFTAENIQLDGLVLQDGLLLPEEGSDSGYVHLNGVDTLLGEQSLQNLYFEWELPMAKDRADAVSGICNITPYVQDEGHGQYTQLADHIYRQDIEASKYLWLQSSGQVRSVVLGIRFSEPGGLRIRRIVANAHRPVLFSATRFFILFILVMAAAGCRGFLRKKENGDRKESTPDLTVLGIGVFLLLTAGYLMQANHFGDTGWGFRPYQQLAEALASGQPYLLETPPEQLIQMANPYDDTARTALGLQENRDYLWDTAYYNGHYYVYFGVVPCLLFYLPMWLLFSVHIQDSFVILFCSSMLYAGIWLLVRTWCRRYHDRIPAAMQVLMTVTIFLGSNAMACLGNPDAHDVPRMCGAMLLAWGLYLWLSAEKTNRICYWRIGVGSLCMALAVGCRPNLALYSAAALVLFGERIIKKQDWKRIWLTVMIPYVPVAIGLMYYNVIRFGSPFDFGFLYNLTVQDYTHAAVSLDRIVLGIHSFFLKVPQLDYKFPFLDLGHLAETNRLGHSELYYTYSFGGLLTCNLITWGLLVLLRFKKGDGQSVRLGQLLAVVAIAQSFVNEFTGGVSYNYLADFAFPLLLAGWEGALYLWKLLREKEGEGMLRGFLVLAAVWSFVFHIQFYFAPTLEMGNTELYYRIFYAFNFL